MAPLGSPGTDTKFEAFLSRGGLSGFTATIVVGKESFTSGREIKKTELCEITGK